MSYPAIFTHALRVTYAECTVGNHVYYARYFDYLEEARGEFFRSLGFPFQNLEDDGFAFPVVHCEADYKSAARYDDELRVEVWLTSLTRISLDFAYRIVATDDRLLFRGLTRHACTDLQNKATRIPDPLAGGLAGYLHGAN